MVLILELRKKKEGGGGGGGGGGVVGNHVLNLKFCLSGYCRVLQDLNRVCHDDLRIV